MPYEQMEDLSQMGQERQISILTTENLIAGGVGTAMVWGLWTTFGWMTNEWFSAQWFFQVFMFLIGFLLGVALTLRWAGISPLYRMILAVGFYSRRASNTTTVYPPTTVVSQSQSRMIPIYRDGQVIARPYSPQAENVDARR